MKRRHWSLILCACAVCLTSACYEPLYDREYHSPYQSPFSPISTISFDVPECMPVRIDIFNVQGQLIGTPFDTIACEATTVELGNPVIRINDTTQTADTIWRGTGELTAGVYFYRLITPVDTITKKMIMLK